MAMKASYYAVGGEILGQESSGSRSDYLRDALGSVVSTVDQASAVTYTARYKPYGANLAATGTAPSFGWVGALGYRSSGLATSDCYVRARHYGSVAGMWRSVDPLWTLEKAYTYVNGKVVSAIDPFGLTPHLPCVPNPCEGCTEAAKSGNLCDFIRARVPKDQLSKFDDTLVACCKGRVEICFGRVELKFLSMLSAIDRAKAEACTKKHEQLHINGLVSGRNKCSSGDCGTINPKHEKDRNPEECSGNIIGATCMLDSFPKGPCETNPALCTLMCNDCDNLAFYCPGRPVPVRLINYCKKIERICSSSKRLN